MPNFKCRRRNYLAVVKNVAVLLVLVYTESIAPTLIAASRSPAVNIKEGEASKYFASEYREPFASQNILPKQSVISAQQLSDRWPSKPPLTNGIYFSPDKKYNGSYLPKILTTEAEPQIGSYRSLNDTHFDYQFTNVPKPRYPTEIAMPFIRNQIPRPPQNTAPYFKNRRQFDYQSEKEPTPFHFSFSNFRPIGAEKCNCSENLERMPAKNIEDILRQSEDSKMLGSKRSGGMRISGRYRRPRGNAMNSYFGKLTKGEINGSEMTRLRLQYHKAPLHSYRPRSPGEINMLAANQFKPFQLKAPRQRGFGSHLGIPNSSENVYQRVNAKEKRRAQQLIDSRASTFNYSRKPFSLSLDIFPMAEVARLKANQEHIPLSLQSPYMPLPVVAATADSSQVSYQPEINYHGIQFSEHQQPENSHSPGFNQFSYPTGQDHLNLLEAEKLSENEVNKNPSQIMVHLNLYPKRKSRLRGLSNPFSSISPGYQLNETIAKMDTGVAAEMQPILVASNGIKALDDPKFVGKGRVATKDEVENTYAINGETEKSGIQANLVVPEESVLKFQYSDAVTIMPE